jgi:hypothetical protein
MAGDAVLERFSCMIHFSPTECSNVENVSPWAKSHFVDVRHLEGGGGLFYNLHK